MALNLSKLMKQKGPPLQGAPPPPADMAGLMANGAPPPPAGPGPAGGLGALMAGGAPPPMGLPGQAATKPKSKPKPKRGGGKKGY